MTLHEQTDLLYWHIRAYKIDRDDAHLIDIHTLADAIRHAGYIPRYYKRDQGVVVSRVESLNPALQVIDNA